MGFHLVLERKHAHRKRMIKWVQPRTPQKMCMCKKRIKVIRGFERENTHIKKEWSKALKRDYEGLCTWKENMDQEGFWLGLKENAHREIMIRGV